MENKKETKEIKFGLVSSVKAVCRDKHGNIKWVEEATDEKAAEVTIG